MEYYRIKNWEHYQHYTDRCPPWIKLHYDILSSRDWVMLADASRVLMVVSMVIASRNDGKVPADPEYIARVAYMRNVDFKPLIDVGFLELASGCKQVLADESECYTDKKTDKSTDKKEEYVHSFSIFWEAYPKKKDKARAYKAWKSANVNGRLEEVLSALEKQKQSKDWLKANGQYIPLPSTWINGKRWEDDSEPEPPEEVYGEKMYFGGA